jgi:membrane-associated phospholipid phosphatase
MTARDVNVGTAESGSFPVAPRRALAAAALLALALVACWYAAFHSVMLARADTNAYFAFLGLSQHHHVLASIARWVADLCRPTPFVYLAALPVIIALVRRRWSLALAIAVMIPAAVLTSETLKPLLASPRPAVGAPATAIGASGSWPSGHATAAMSLAMAFMLASPARLRPYVAVLGTLFSLAVMYSVLSLGWHFPSDVLGGILVASIFTLLAVAAVVHVDARYGRDLSRLASARGGWLDHMPSVPAMLAAIALPGAAVLLARGGHALAYAGDHRAFVAALVGIAALGGLAPTALTVVLSGNGPAARAALRSRSPRG